MAPPKDKYKFALWIYPKTLEKVKEAYKKDNCRSKSEFIEKAIEFYTAHITAKDESSYLPSIFLSSLKSIITESDNKNNRMLFKIAVELSILQNIIAATNDIDKLTLNRLRGECIKEVKRLNGTLSFEDAVDWQKG